MTRIKTNDGKPVFQNPSQSWRDLTGELPDQEPEAAMTSMMQGMYGVPASVQKKEGGDEQAASPQEVMQVALGNLFNVVTGTQPASAQYADGKKDSDYIGMENAEMLSAALRRRGSVDLSPAVGPMPQLGAAAETRAPVPLSIGPNNPYFVAIGLNEGTRTASGGYTRAWSGHTDPGDGAMNRGTISARSGSPRSADRFWSGRLTGQAIEARSALLAAGLRDNTVGFQRVMFNVLDLAVQAPGAVPDFISKLPNMQAAEFTIESVAKARTDSYINPSTGRLEASGFGNSYNRLFQDQRSRAGTFDYKKEDLMGLVWNNEQGRFIDEEEQLNPTPGGVEASTPAGVSSINPDGTRKSSFDLFRERAIAEQTANQQQAVDMLKDGPESTKPVLGSRSGAGIY